MFWRAKIASGRGSRRLPLRDESEKAMDSELLEGRFARMGARLKVEERAPWDRDGGLQNVTIDVQWDRQGEFFAIRTRPESRAELEVIDLQPAERHLLLQLREGDAKLKFLCGHDERQWFVAGVPDRAGVGTVEAAMEALKPLEVQRAQVRAKVKTEDRKRRKNAAYRRQGEWFFLPVPDLAVEERLVLRH